MDNLQRRVRFQAFTTMLWTLFLIVVIVFRAHLYNPVIIALPALCAFANGSNLIFLLRDGKLSNGDTLKTTCRKLIVLLKDVKG